LDFGLKNSGWIGFKLTNFGCLNLVGKGSLVSLVILSKNFPWWIFGKLNGNWLFRKIPNHFQIWQL